MSGSYSACSSRLVVTHPNMQHHASGRTLPARWPALHLCQTQGDSVQMFLAWPTSFAPRKWWAQQPVETPPAHICVWCTTLEAAPQNGWILHVWTSYVVVVEETLWPPHLILVAGSLAPCILLLLGTVVSFQCCYRTLLECPNVMCSTTALTSNVFSAWLKQRERERVCHCGHTHNNNCNNNNN